MSIEMISLLDTVIAKRATDLQLEVGGPPMIRVRGILEPIGSAPLTASDTVRLRDAIVGGDTKAKPDTEDYAEFGFGYGGAAHRFLVTVFRQGENYGLILRYLLADPACPESCPVCGAPPRKK